MKKKKILNIVLLILVALPIPLTVKALIRILMSPSDMSENYSLFAVLLANTYLVSYIIFLVATLKNKKNKLISFLPLLHIALFCIFAFVSIQLDTTERYVDNRVNELRIRKNNKWIYNVDFTEKYKDTLDVMFDNNWVVKYIEEKREEPEFIDSHMDSTPFIYNEWTIQYTDANSKSQEFILTNSEALSDQIEYYLEQYIPITYKQKFVDVYLKDVPRTDGASYAIGFIDTMHVSTYSDDLDIQKAEKENEERIIKSDKYVENLETPEGTICIAKLTPANVFDMCPYYLSLHISIDDKGYSDIDKKTLESHVKDQVETMISDMNIYTNNKLNAEISVVSCREWNDLYDGEHKWNWFYIQGTKKNVLTPMYFERDIYDSYKGKFW